MVVRNTKFSGWRKSKVAGNPDVGFLNAEIVGGGITLEVGWMYKKGQDPSKAKLVKLIGKFSSKTEENGLRLMAEGMLKAMKADKKA